MDGNTTNSDRLETLALDLVDESPTNPRKRFDQAKLEELAQDIAANGLIQPVVVRPRGERFELVVGARRTRASKIAGRSTILAIVRDIEDRAALEVQLSENASRQDVHPLEEADGYAQLLEVHHATIEEVAAKVGKPVGYVRHRLQYRALCPAGREAFFAGKLTPHTALLVARIPVEALQVQALEEITASRWNGDTMTPREAGDHVRHRFMLRLAAATFDRGDATLVPAAGACTNCPKRTGNQAELFADVDSPDTCTDPGCFASKKDAHWQRVTEKAKAKGQAVLSEKAAEKVFPYGDNVAQASEYVDVTDKPYDGGGKTYKSLLGKDHLPPITIAKDKTGMARELVKKEDLARAMKAAGLSSKAAAPSPSSNYEAQEREKKAQRRAVIDRAVAQLVPAAEARKADLALWVFVAEALLTSSWDAVKAVEKRRGIFNDRAGGGAALPKALATMKEPQVRALVVELIVTKASVYGSIGDDFRAACKMLGVDLKKIESAVSAERKAAKKAKAKKGAKGKASAPKGKGKPAQARRSAEEEDEGEDDGDDGDDGEEGAEDETETRVWVAMTAWDSLDAEARAHLEEPIVGSEVGWCEIGEYMSALVPGAELLEALRSESQRRGVKLHEGEDAPAAAAPVLQPAAADEGLVELVVRADANLDGIDFYDDGSVALWTNEDGEEALRTVVPASMAAAVRARLGDRLVSSAPSTLPSHVTGVGREVRVSGDGSRTVVGVVRSNVGGPPGLVVVVDGEPRVAWVDTAHTALGQVMVTLSKVDAVERDDAGWLAKKMAAAPAERATLMLYLRDTDWSRLTDAQRASIGSPAPGVNALNIRPAGAEHRELGPLTAEEWGLVRAAAIAAGLEVFDVRPGVTALPAQRVIIVSTEGDDWMGARKGLAAWAPDKTPGAGVATGRIGAPLAMLHTPLLGSGDIDRLLARYAKAGRLVLDLGEVAGEKVFDCDPSNRAVREQWNAAHPGARVEIAAEKVTKKASKKGAK